MSFLSLKEFSPPGPNRISEEARVQEGKADRDRSQAVLSVTALEITPLRKGLLFWVTE